MNPCSKKFIEKNPRWLILQNPVPINSTTKLIKDLMNRGLGLKRYYNNFVNIYGQRSWSLTIILKNEAFSWTQEETKYF